MDAVIHEDPESGGVYVAFPWDIQQEFGKGRVKVNATFDGIEYAGSSWVKRMETRSMLS